jgi:hypothetical protein
MYQTEGKPIIIVVYVGKEHRVSTLEADGRVIQGINGRGP